MTCTSCGKSIPSGTRYCAHCGAEQGLPTPIAAVAAAATMSRATRALAANAAQVEPGIAAHRDAANQASAAAELVAPTPGRRAAPPAYATGPRRQGVAVAMIAMVAFLTLAAAVVWWMRHERGDVPQRRPVADSREAAPGRDAPGASETATGSSSAGVPVAASASSHGVSEAEHRSAGRASTPIPPSGGVASDPDGVPRIQIKPLPTKPARAGQRAGSRVRPATDAALSSAPAAAVSSSVMPTQSVAPVTRVADPATNRWRRMSEEMSRCTREDFIARVVCGQRVRFEYCDGYWGKVAQCPANPTPERGQ